jgi:two-component system, LytTR family, sensor kinase
MKKINSEIAFNLLFWLSYFFYEWLGLAALSGEYAMYFINACMALPLSFIVSYLTVHFLIKRYYNHGKKLEFWISQILLSVTLLIARRLINYYLVYPANFPAALHVPLFSFGKLIIELVNLYLIVGVYSLFYFVQSWYLEKQRTQSLETAKRLAELELLKSQVQPHFIFNALNNIYSTALKGSPDTATLIAHLSDFLNYNLYEAKQDFVPLSSEIDHIRHYIELQKNRFGEKVDISINVYDDITGLYLAPMLLLPLVENTFKHGIHGAITAGWLRIDISKGIDHFTIKIENSLDQSPNGAVTSNGGIGVENVQNRLNLIYPGTHEFKTACEPHSYLVTLKIQNRR